MADPVIPVMPLAVTINMTDHDLLIRIDERVEDLRRLLNDHLHAHSRLIWVIFGAFVTACVGLLVAWVHP